MGKQISSARLLERLWSGAGELVDRAGMLLGPEGHVPDADAVHEIRVISKRLRAVWQLLRPALGAEVARPPEREMRRLAKAFESRRGLAAMVETLDRLEALPAAGRSVAAAESAVLEALRQRIGESGEVDRAPVRSDPEWIGIIEAQRFALRDRLQPMRPRDWGEGIARSYRKGRRAARDALAAERRGDSAEAVEAWHRARRQAKYELYQIELLGRVAGSGSRRAMLARFGKRAGRFHDLQELRRFADCLAPEPGLPDAREILEGVIVRAEAPLSRELHRLRRRLYPARPRDRAARVTAAIRD
jgi:CHAD domain-containing protein